MVELPQNFDLILQRFWIFDHFLSDELDHTIGVGWFFEPCLVDDSICAPAEDLSVNSFTLGLNS